MLLLAQLFCEISKDDVFIAYSGDIPILGNREPVSLEIDQNSSQAHRKRLRVTLLKGWL